MNINTNYQMTNNYSPKFKGVTTQVPLHYYEAIKLNREYETQRFQKVLDQLFNVCKTDVLTIIKESLNKGSKIGQIILKYTENDELRNEVEKMVLKNHF